MNVDMLDKDYSTNTRYNQHEPHTILPHGSVSSTEGTKEQNTEYWPNSTEYRSLSEGSH